LATERLETALGRYRSQIVSHLHGAFASRGLIREVLSSYDGLVAELAARPDLQAPIRQVFAGVRRLGTIRARYGQLVSAFGAPGPGDGANTDVFWVVAPPFEGIVTIYNWKNGHAYHGPPGLDVAAMTEWEVGGTSRESLMFIRDHLDGL